MVWITVTVMFSSWCLVVLVVVYFMRRNRRIEIPRLGVMNPTYAPTTDVGYMDPQPEVDTEGAIYVHLDRNNFYEIPMPSDTSIPSDRLYDNQV